MSSWLTRRLSHHVLYLALGNRLFLAPLETPQKVLDVGTGTGIWALYSFPFLLTKSSLLTGI